MVDINPKFNPGESSPSWLGSSQKPDASLSKPDKSMETLFSGIGDLVTQSTQTAYNTVNEKIKKTWSSVFEPVRDAQGVGDTTEGATVGVTSPAADKGPQGQNIPAAVSESFAERAQKLTAAHADGKVSNPYYYSQLNALTRQMKAQFPGFGEEVDRLVQQTTGVVPANALRNAMLEKLDAASTKAEKVKKDQQDFVRTNAGNTDVATRKAIYEAIQRGEDLTKFYPSVFAQATEISAKEALVKRETAELVNLEHQGKSTERLAAEVFTRQATDARTDLFKRGIQSISRPIMEALEGKRELTAKEVEGLSGQAEMLEQAMRQSFDQLLDRRDPSGKSLRERLKISEIDGLIAQQLAPIKALKEAIVNDKTGLAGHFARVLSSQESEQAKRVRENFPIVAAIGAMQKAGVPKEIVQLIYREDNQIQSDVLKAARETFLPKVISGQGTMGELLDGLKKAGANRQQFMGTMTTVANILASNTPHQSQVNLARALFKEENIVDRFPGQSSQVGSAGDGTNIFLRLTRPDVAESMRRLDKTHSGIYKQYSDWVLRNFQSSARQIGHNVASNMNNEFVQINWDSNIQQFIPTHTPAALEFLSNRGIRGRNALEAISQQNSSAMRTIVAVDSLNKALLAINPILKEQNTDTTKALQALFTSWGVNKSKPEETGLFKTLYDAVIRGKPKESTDPDLSEGVRKGLFGSVPVVNFQRASGDSTGTGTPKPATVRPVRTRPARNILEVQPRPVENPVPGGLGATLGSSESAFSPNDLTISQKIQKSEVGQKVIRGTPTTVIPGKKTKERAR